MSTSFDLRLVAYNPLGARLGVLPDLGLTITSTATGPSLTATVSTANLGQIGSTLPKALEVAVETWRDTDGGIWKEQRDSRFAIIQQDYDGRDKSGTVTLTGVGLAAWLMQGAALKGVNYLAYTSVATEAALSATISVSGTTWTWTGNPIGNGDRVQIVAKGNSKVDTGSIYYARDLSGNNFSLARTVGGAPINAGVASNVQVKRVVTRLIITGGHSFTRSQAVRTTAGGATNLADTTTYYVVNPTGTTLQLAEKPGGIPLDLQVGSTAIGTIYTDIDGQRNFNSATPGTIMSSAFLEARARGWGVNPTDSSQQMLHGWTTTLDSTGTAWNTIAADPTTPGVSMSFQPGTPATQILSFMLENQYAEWYSSGRTIHLVNYGTGNDHSVDTLPVRIGRTATSVPVTVDLSGERNSYVVRGYGAVYVEVQAGTIGPWGVLEDYQTYTGITSKTAATKQANTNISTNQGGQIGYKVTENAGEADFLPTINYSRGDWIAAQVDSDGWTKLRVLEWSYAKTPDGTITVTTTLQYAKRSPLVKAIKGSVTTTAGITDAGSLNSPALDNDRRKGAAPVISSVSQVGRFAADDSATAVVTVNWAAVSADIDGNPLSIRNYEVWLREEGKSAGYAVGATAGLTMDLPALPSGRWYAVSVRAQSDTGQWGELSAETEFQTVFPTDVPNPPTAPTLSGRLGQVRVAWDGNLVDPTLGTVAASASTQRGFAYVQVWFSTTLGGTYTQIGSNMGNAGSVAVSGLTIGSTYYFALVAFNVVGSQSAQGTAASYTVVGVTGPDLVANSVTANAIAAGAISTDKLAIGAVPANASPTERVPTALVTSSYWSQVINGTIPLGAASVNVVAGSTGVTFTGTSSVTASMPVTSVLPVPPSGALHVAIISSTSSTFAVVSEFNAAGTLLGNYGITPSVRGTRYMFTNSTATSYQVRVTTNAGATVTDLVSTVHVFEVISTAGVGQGVELSPAGLQFFDNNGSLAMDLTTNSQQFFQVFDATGADPLAVASIDSSGNASFNGVSTNTTFDFQGILLTDPSDAEGILNASPNGSTWDPNVVPVLERFGRGVIYDVTWTTQNGVVLATQYRRIAQDQFTAEDGRSYMLDVQTAGLQADLTSAGTVGGAAAGVNCYLELQLNTVPNTAITSGDTVNRAVVYNNTRGYWALPPVIWTASASQASIDHTNRIMPAGVPIYWQLNWNMSTTPSSGINIAEFGGSRGLTVIDLGSSRLTRPINGADTLALVTDSSTSGSSSGSTSGGTTTTSTTKTFTATSSRTWNNGGASIVTGSGQYTNGAAMYVGTGASSMGSWFGNFKSGASTMASILSGKTITAATLKIKCNYTYSSAGSTVPMGTASTVTAPATIGAPASNVFSASVKAGATKSIALSSAIRSGLSSGSVNSFVIGVASGAAGVYSYFAGATQSGPPTLTVTYH